MTTAIPFVPETADEARELVAEARSAEISTLPRDQFVAAWSSVAYLFPELHPDAVDEWPADLQPFAIEAWRRADVGELSEEELYPSDAQWCGLCDRMAAPTVEESTRRMSFVRRPMVQVGDVVRYRNPFPDEANLTFRITEWNIDRGFGLALGTTLNYPPVVLLRFRDIERVDAAHG
jgi:hypothetical protein